MVDDLVYQGRTLKTIKEYLLLHEAGVKSVTTAVFFNSDEADFLPDVFAEDKGTDWTVFPYEQNEFKD